MRIKIRVNNRIITRKVRVEPCGNFVMNIVRYNNEYYLVGEGDEYLRGYSQVFTLGKKLHMYK